MTKPNGWEENYEEKVFKFITGMLGQYGKPLNELTELQKSMLEVDCRKITASVIHEISQDYISQAILSAEERAKQDFKERVELWMATHDKLDKTFSTDDFIKYIIQDEN